MGSKLCFEAHSIARVHSRVYFGRVLTEEKGCKPEHPILRAPFLVEPERGNRNIRWLVNYFKSVAQPLVKAVIEVDQRLTEHRYKRRIQKNEHCPLFEWFLVDQRDRTDMRLGFLPFEKTAQPLHDCVLIFDRKERI
jgi:hypothetical protein